MLPAAGAIEMAGGAVAGASMGAADAAKSGGGDMLWGCGCCCCWPWLVLGYGTADVMVTPGRKPLIWVLDVTLGMRMLSGWPLVTAPAAAAAVLTGA